MWSTPGLQVVQIPVANRCTMINYQNFGQMKLDILITLPLSLSPTVQVRFVPLPGLNSSFKSVEID